MALISLSAYARMRGCSHQAVSKAAKDGRITAAVTTVDGKVRVDPEHADRLWKRNTDPVQQARGSADQFAKTHEDEAPTPSLVQEKLESERVRRELLELELAERRGELLNAANAEKAWAAQCVAAGEAFGAMPDRLAVIFAAESDAARIHEMLTEEIRLALQRLAGVAPKALQ